MHPCDNADTVIIIRSFPHILNTDFRSLYGWKKFDLCQIAHFFV